MTIDVNPTTGTDTESTLTKLAKAGDVDTHEETTKEEQIATAVSSIADLAEMAQATIETLKETGVIQLPAPTPVTETAKPAKHKKKAKKAQARTKSAKSKAKAEKKAAPSSGQSGPAITLDIDDLNAKELKVLKVFSLDREEITIAALAKGAWPTNTQGKNNSWTRNSLRRLVRSNLVEKMERGLYRLSVKGRNRMLKAA